MRLMFHNMFTKFKNIVFGAPQDPFDVETRKKITMISFLAWIGLGADGISSACYGPEEGFLALGTHSELTIYLAIATALTIFIISYAYTQIIELFPNGGGGYRVATKLLGPKAGLVSGCALVIDYVLTISVSVASGIDAIFSFMPEDWQIAKIFAAISVLILLAMINLRGMKESIKFLMPIFLLFITTHIIIIIYGVSAHYYWLPDLIPEAVTETHSLTQSEGWMFVMSLFLKAFSMGAGTYTGLEAVSNNIHTISEPRVRNGKITMFLIAISLAFTAAGMILLYLLWDVEKIDSETLNATVLYNITHGWSFNDFNLGKIIVPVILCLEAGLLLVAANTGFLAGPSVIANMAADEWMPKSFASLSSRLVVKNGILLMTVAAIATLLITKGKTHILVVLYSINVFITFSLSMLGLMVYWINNRKRQRWKTKLTTAVIGFITCASILVVTVSEKFYEGGWITLLITSVMIAVGFMIKYSYHRFRDSLNAVEQQLQEYEKVSPVFPVTEINKNASTAAIIVDQNFSSGMNCLLEIKKLFPGAFRNFVFVTAGEVNLNVFREEHQWQEMRRKTKAMLLRYKNYCNANGRFVKAYIGYGTDTIEKLTQLSIRVSKEYPNTVFFVTKFIFEDENFFTQILYNHLSYIIQRILHGKGLNIVILPMKIENLPSCTTRFPHATILKNGALDQAPLGGDPVKY